MDAMEVEQVTKQENETRKSFKVLDQNVMKERSEEKKGAKTKNAGKWKRIIKQSQEEKVLSSDENKKSGNKRGNKRSMMVDEEVIVEEGKVQERE